jgi:predicted TIM-barrel fold metal-dependent hydrolase
LTVADIDRSIPFIDTHHHLWDLERLEYAWLKEPGRPQDSVRLGDYRMIRSTIGMPDRLFREFYGANVVKSVHVEADYTGPDPVDETIWLEGVASEYGFPHAFVVNVDLSKVGADRQLERHMAASSRVRGVRMREQPDDPASPTFLGGYRALASHGLSYELNASPGRILSGLAVARVVSNVQVILVHAGYPVQRDAEYFARWQREVSLLARAENVACKVSGLGMADHQWTIESIRPYVLHCIDAFGPHRIMFGTNWPVDLLYASYLETVDSYRLICVDAGFSRQEQAQMLWQNAEKYYRI